ncbi:MAG TPA: VWA domain-containing protein [Anaeromyxobacter sp.]
MERVVARFVARLRERGLRVSPGESVDAVRALGASGVLDRARARAALQLTLVKTMKDLPAFEEEFELFFRDGAPVRPRAVAGEVVEAAVLELQTRQVREVSPEEGERSGLTLLAEDGAADELDLESLIELEGDAGGAAQITVERRHRGEKARAPRPHQYTGGPIYYRLDEEFLSRWRNDGVKPFSPEEEAAMQEVVGRMVRRLKKDVRQPRSKERRGRLHVVKTLQKNYRHGLVPFTRVLRRRRKELPRLVVLCDVSYSVSHASRFMLLLLHTLQQGVLDVRSFIFNKQLAEITALLESMPVNATLEAIDRGELVSLDDHSDFGHVFRSFQREHLASLRGRPAVIVLGDARNNYNEPSEDALAEIRERAGHVMWLTPEDRSSWDLGDCLMSAYGPHCDRVEVVKNVEELSAVVEQLVRGFYAGATSPRRIDRRPWSHGGIKVRP